MGIRQLLIYSEAPSPRLRYIARTLLSDGLGFEIGFTSDLRAYESASCPRLNYSAEELPGLCIIPSGLLFESGIKDHPVEPHAHPEYFRIFFQTRGELPFDIFAAAFWLITRYEEYLPHRSDHHGRFHFKSSLAYQYDFLEIPLVNVWLNAFAAVLRQKFPELVVRRRTYNFCPTIDIDNAYKFLHKGFVRTLAGFVKDALTKDFRGLRERLSIIWGYKADPFDVYSFLIQSHRARNLRAVYFVLLGDYGVNDKNHSANHLKFQELIKHLCDYAEVGIHPSFGSGISLQKLKVEASRLSSITHFPVQKSRQHFAMLKFPVTYRNLSLAGITEDYSMGYTNRNGFRASWCYPFQWYSLEDEQESSLRIHPFCISGNTLSYYAKAEGKNSQELAEPLIRSVKAHGGELVTVFHNDSMDAVMQQEYLKILDQAL